MEYSKEVIIKNKYGDVENLKETAKWTSKIKKRLRESKAMSFIFAISLICTMLIIADIVLIFNFVRIMQSVL